MNKVKRLVDCPNCGTKALSWVEDVNLTSEEAKKLEKIINLLKSNKDPYKKKLELFNLLKKLEVGEMLPEKKERVNLLLQAHLYGDLAKQSMRDYKKVTAKAFGKVE